MARIDIKSTGTTLSDGVLQLENGVAMDATLRKVADQNNTTSPLKLSTALVQTTSTLKITTADNPYIDAEDNSGNNRFTIGRDPASQIVNVDFASNPTGSTSQVGAIRTYQDGVNLSDVVKFREDGQVTFTERVNVEADSLVTTQSSSVIAATTTNANLVISPNGTGALVANVPDGTSTGGNPRGTNAVDLQMSRSNLNQIASGSYSFLVGQSNSAGSAYTVVGGQSNTASSTGSVIFGRSNSSQGDDGVVFGNGNTVGSVCSQSGVLSGNANTVSSARSVICGGQTNTASGTHSVVSGGQSNTASGAHSTVSGGQSNTASTATHATVVGGQSNTSSGAHALSGGYVCNATGIRSTAFGEQSSASGLISFAAGSNCTATANTAFSLGNLNAATSSYSLALGLQSKTYLISQLSSASGQFATQGDSQQSLLTANRSATLTTGGTTTLSLDGTGTTSLIIPSGTNRMWNVQVRWVAVVTTITGTATGVTVGDTKTSTDLLAVAKRAGTTTVSAHTSAGTHVIETTAGSLTAANITYSAGASQEMDITFTGPTFVGGGSVTMRVVAAISLTEVSY